MSCDVLRIKKLDPKAQMPKYETPGSSGMDLRARIDESIRLGPGEWKLIPTGLSMSIPLGYEAQVRPRSGLALKRGLTVLNSPGTIDQDYRGHVQVILINQNSKVEVIVDSMRIAQLVLAKVEQPEIEEVKDLDDTERAENGFGSTGEQ